MKRTLKNGDKKRDCVLRFRLTCNEKTIIQQRAKDHRMTISNFGRKAMMSNDTSQLADREILLRHLADLGKIGSNVNQIAKSINIRMKTGELINVSQHLISSTMQSIDNLTKHLLGILTNGSSRKNQG